MTFEFTAVNTLQQNGRVERKVEMIYGRVHSMLTAAGIQGGFRQKLLAEAGSTAMHLMNIQVTNPNKKTPYEKFTGKKDLPKYAIINKGRRLEIQKGKGGKGNGSIKESAECIKTAAHIIQSNNVFVGV